MKRAVSSRYKLVDRYVVHPGYARLADRIAEIVPSEADYVVFDLDRTVHLGVTIGEKLGWEILSDPRQRQSIDHLLPVFSARHPLRSLSNGLRGADYWGLPGLLYASTVRLGDRWTGWHRFLSVALGPGYVDRVQSLLRKVLMASAADYSREEMNVFAERAWRRWESRLVVDAEVIAAIRSHCPNLKAVLLSSASIAPTVEHAAGTLGVDGYVSSAVDVYEVEDRAIYSAPADMPRWLRMRRPRFLSRPGAVVHNSSVSKISLLRAAYPDVFSPDSVAVGISDNNYGEDRSWPDHFDHAVAINSRHPFSPFVSVVSPCRSIQLVDARPVAVEDTAAAKATGGLGTLEAKVPDLAALPGKFVEAELGRLDALLDQLRAARERAAAAVDGSLRQTMAGVSARFTDAVERYNQASTRQKAAIARELRRLGSESRRVRARLAKSARDCARIQHKIELLHREAARALVSRGT